MSQKYLEIQIPKNIISILSQCITSSKSFNFQRFNKIKTQETDKFLEDIKITSTQLFKIWKLNLPGIPLCLNCGKRLEGLIDYHTFKPLKYCCHKCQVTDSNNIEKQKQTWKNKSKKDISNMMDKRKKTCIEKYGTEAYCQTDEWKKKYRNSCLEKYSVEGYSQSEEWKKSVEETWQNKPQSEIDKKIEKARKTSIEKYGVENYSQTDEWKDKVKQTNLERYGSESPLQNPEINEKRRKTFLDRYSDNSIIKDKIRKTNLEKYGVEWISQTMDYKDKIQNIWNNKSELELREISEKRKKTSIEKYGVDSYSQTNEWKEKYKQTSLDRYGENSYSKTDESKSYQRRINREKMYDKNKEELSKKYIEILSTKDEYINNDLIKYKCLRCGKEFLTEKTYFKSVYCSKCVSINSLEEKGVLEYIQSIYDGIIIENDREIIKPKELDIYIPEKKLAIEYNGTYWHNLDKVGKYYHQEKSLKCKEQDIRLIHIFEYEWNEKQEICKSIIKSALGIYDKRIYARKCIVKDISANDYKDFLDVNHLQGSINSSIRYGLYYNDELVSVIGFGKSRFKKGEMELHRFCSKLNYQVIGAFSKLIKHSNVTNFITYVDLAHFSGDGYKKIGFKEISITEPNYKWIKDTDILNRFQTQKHKLNTLLLNYNELLTETENMEMNGYVQIFDSGNIKLTYEK